VLCTYNRSMHKILIWFLRSPIISREKFISTNVRCKPKFGLKFAKRTACICCTKFAPLPKCSRGGIPRTGRALFIYIHATELIQRAENILSPALHYTLIKHRLNLHGHNQKFYWRILQLGHSKNSGKVICHTTCRP